MVFLNSSREQPSLPFTYPSWEATPSSSSSSSTSVLTTSTFSVSSSTSPLLSCPSGVSNSACLLQKQRQMRHLIAEKLPSPELPFASFVHSGHSRELRGRTGPEILSDFGFKSLFSQALEETTEGEEEERVIKGKKKQKGSRTYKSFHLKIGNASARRLFSGAFAGAVSRTAVAPLETIRTHLMVGSSGLNVHDVFKHIMQEEGWQGLFRGNGVNVIRVAPSKAIERGTYKNLMDAFIKICEEEGPKELYRGLTPSLIGVVPYAATNYFAYDFLRKLYKKVTKEEQVGNLPTLLIGSAAGAFASASTFPLEVARKQMQVGALSGRPAYDSLFHALSSILEQQGPAGLYRGLGASCIKLVPAAGISFMCYEACKRILIEEEKR
ncbi:hypothetical protein KP509_26G071900 [Ceratopteris richardii]|uniref:Uncharacterized protein n=1 Tax=Ceratopteris richardii TaxID=49495 RepID=A0A8T2RPQ5_CERRI|nr:hypothetical protein KP509_26G071900 [Ceratopteris richardii]